MSFFLRWLFAFLLVAATFNPSDWNYVRWSRQNFETQMPLVVFLGLILLIAYIVYLRATLRSIGAFGMFLILAVLGSLIWVLSDWGWLSLSNTDGIVWIGILSLSVVLGVGLSWSFVRRTLSGQYDVDDSDE
jgi:hypothetical protein